MPRVTVTVQPITVGGLTPVYTLPATSTAGGNAFVNDGKCFIEMKNVSAGPIVANIYVPVTVDGLAVATRTVTVIATSGDSMIGPFPPGIYNQTDGCVYYDFGATVTNLTAGVFSL